MQHLLNDARLSHVPAKARINSQAGSPPVPRAGTA